jgi:hypothetical protein
MATEWFDYFDTRLLGYPQIIGYKIVGIRDF